MRNSEMTHPTWNDYELVESNPEYGDVWEGTWDGVGRNGQRIEVPCVFTEDDVNSNSPAQLETLKQLLKENGLEAWYETEEWSHYAI
jgi:hypothetical protein